MWAIIIFSVLLLVFLVMGISRLVDGELFKFACYWVLSFFVYLSALFSAGEVGIRAPRVTAGYFYEVMATMPVANGDGILVYVTDLKSSKKKADILVLYPFKGYKIEKVGKRDFLLPMNTVIATDDKGETFFVSEDGEVIDIPPVVMAGK